MNQDALFEPFPKIARLNRTCVISEKLDGTNAQVIITEDGRLLAASRSRLITPDNDNYGFARWVEGHRAELMQLGPGRHFGEWWGNGIQRGYGLKEKRFSLFNVARWGDDAVRSPGGYTRPACCHVVPVLYTGLFHSHDVGDAMMLLGSKGSVAAPGFMKPEGVIIWHEAARIGFKVTLEKDSEPKGIAA